LIFCNITRSPKQRSN